MAIAAIAAALALLAPTGVAPATPLMGGDLFLHEGMRCVVGFNAHDRAGRHQVLTGGGCARPDLVGPVPAPAGTTSTPYVRGPGGTPIAVRGAVPVPVGGVVCKAGPTTGWRCGTVIQVNVSLVFPGGVYHGLTRTNICAEPGERGTPVVSPDGQAQGVMVAGSGNCTSGGSTYFEPVTRTLQTHGLRLHTV